MTSHCECMLWKVAYELLTYRPYTKENPMVKLFAISMKHCLQTNEKIATFIVCHSRVTNTVTRHTWSCRRRTSSLVWLALHAAALVPLCTGCVHLLLPRRPTPWRPLVTWTASSGRPTCACIPSWRPSRSSSSRRSTVWLRGCRGRCWGNAGTSSRRRHRPIEPAWSGRPACISRSGKRSGGFFICY